MAMLQRRMASTIYAVRRSLERMRDRREKILADPEAYRQEQIAKKVPDDFDELTDEEQQEIIAELEDVVASIDPAILKKEIAELGRLVDHAKILEQREVETKLQKLKDVLQEQGFFADRSKKLIVFTEHKDSLDYLAGDGREGRPDRQASVVGVVGRPDSRRHEDRRPRQCWIANLGRARVSRERPGPRRDRSRRRGHQPAVLLADDQLRHPLESGATRAARWPHPSLRPGA